MAYYYGEEDKDKNEAAPQTSAPSSVIPATGASGGNAPVNATTNNARTNPGNFVGISQYLDANKPQAAGLANKVGGVVTGAADAARNELNMKVGDTTKLINSNTINYDQNQLNQLNKDAAKADVNAITRMKNATYSGPDSFGNINSLANAQQNVASLDTEEGRKGLVGNLYKDQPLKKGALSFDNLLLQASPESKNILSEAKNKANLGGLQNDIATQQANIAKQAQLARDTTTATAKKTQDAIKSAQTGFESGLQKRVDALRKSSTKEAQGVLDRLASGGGLTGQASAKDLNLLGITQDQYQKLVSSGTAADLAKNNASIGDGSSINAGNVASAEDYARYNVLKQLAGGGNLLGKNASQAGKYNTDLLDFNYVEPPAPPPPEPMPVVPITETMPETKGADVKVSKSGKDDGVYQKLEAGANKALKKLKWS